MPLLLRRSAPSPSVDDLACPKRNHYEIRSKCSTVRCYSIESTETDSIRGSCPHEIERISEKTYCEDDKSVVDDEDDDSKCPKLNDATMKISLSDSDSPCCNCLSHSKDLKSEKSNTSSDMHKMVAIKDNQLAILDAELRNLKKTFSRKVGHQFGKLYRSLGFHSNQRKLLTNT